MKDHTLIQTKVRQIAFSICFLIERLLKMALGEKLRVKAYAQKVDGKAHRLCGTRCIIFPCFHFNMGCRHKLIKYQPSPSD